MSDLSCPICRVAVEVEDDIGSTICGHVFHLECFAEWKQNSPKCPECRRDISTIQQIFPDFEAAADIEDMHTQLNQKIHDTSVLEFNLDERERGLYELNIKYTIVDDKLKEAQEKLEYLKIQKDNRELQINSMNASHYNATAVTLRERIKVLNLKLNHFTKLLQKEKRNAIDLVFDKIRLQNMLMGRENIEETYENPSAKVNSADKKETNLKQLYENQQAVKKVNSANIKKESKNNKHGIIIKGPSSIIFGELCKDLVSKLAKFMKIDEFDPDYIEDTRFLVKQKALVIFFQTADLQTKFIKNQCMLKRHPTVAPITIDDYNSLYIYAKENLKMIGYRYIYSNLGKVFARPDKKTRSIRIFDEAQVDAMVLASKSKNDLASSTNDDAMSEAPKLKIDLAASTDDGAMVNAPKFKNDLAASPVYSPDSDHDHFDEFLYAMAAAPKLKNDLAASTDDDAMVKAPKFKNDLAASTDDDAMVNASKFKNDLAASRDDSSDVSVYFDDFFE